MLAPTTRDGWEVPVRQRLAAVRTCTFCGAALDDDEAADPRREGDDILCDACWDARHTYECWLCLETEDETERHTYLVVMDPARCDLALPGLYRIDRTPYYWDGMLAAGIYPRAVTWLGYLPEPPDAEGSYAAGDLCARCRRACLDHITYMARCSVAALGGC